MKGDQEFVKEVTSQMVDFSQWYLDVVLKAELMDYAPVKGCMAIRPYGYAIWEHIQQLLGERIKATGHKNAYFPLFIPQSLLQKEADHVEGFAPEVALVTRGGGEELAEKLVVRPTSEAIICSMYAKWVQSWRDLPLLINQWCNVVRWEKNTRPFLRTSEFLWQEGHTVHATEAEAEEETLKMLGVYREFVENELAIPVIAGRKTEKEKFAGALRTYSIEALMSDGRALQAGTSHNLGQHFARVFGIQFQDRDDELKYAWQTSWGVSTRLIGALIMVHGDDRGLRMPPRVAPVQVVIIPIIMKKKREEVLAKARELMQRFAGTLRLELDEREGYSPGWKFNEWEMKGVPLRLEVGPRDLENGGVTAVRRDTGEKSFVPETELEQCLPMLLREIQEGLFQQALRFRRENTRYAENFGQFKEIVVEQKGFVLAHWCGEAGCEERIKEETKATIRCLPLEEMDGGKVEGPCICCLKGRGKIVYFARAY
ncbi:MAG TPA: proline--tRNA ligase [Firmicutes bacterium]|nr:proline--tRNA ligase [Bacillota bacterium]